LLEARVIIASYNDHCPAPFYPSLFGWFRTTKVYSGIGAGVVMESILMCQREASTQFFVRMQIATRTKVTGLAQKRKAGAHGSGYNARPVLIAYEVSCGQPAVLNDD